MQRLHPWGTDDTFEVAALLLTKECGANLSVSSEVTVLIV